MVFIHFLPLPHNRKRFPQIGSLGEKKSWRKYKLYTEALSEKWFQVPLYPRRSPKYEDN